MRPGEDEDGGDKDGILRPRLALRIRSTGKSERG